MLKSVYLPYNLIFRQAVGTSRGVLTEKPSWFLLIRDDNQPKVYGVGECSIIPGLSIDPISQIEDELIRFCKNGQDYIANLQTHTKRFPAVTFAIETALLDLQTGGKLTHFDSPFARGECGIPINGLVWMGSKDFMRKQVIEKIEAGFSVIKIKIGAIDFEEELELIRFIRKEFDSHTISIRLDANGAFNESEVIYKLEALSKFNIHSIEQPVKPGQLALMCKLAAESPVPVALDEELIGVNDEKEMQNLLDIIRPSYIIIKPSLLGGFKQSEKWIQMAESFGIGWWATSALESNIGLNAIAHWVASKKVSIPQGLGTGLLYSNNISSPLKIENGALWKDLNLEWSSIF